MAHILTTARAACVAALAAAGTLASTRVYSERIKAVQAAELPCIRVFINTESQTGTSMAGGRANRNLDRTAVLQVDYLLKQSSGYITAGDEALRLIEIAMANVSGGGIKDIVPAGTVFDEQTEGELPLYTVSQQFQIFYMTTQGNPAVAN